MFKKAKLMKIFDDTGREFVNFVGVVNEENNAEEFNVVSPGYKIIQHDEVNDTIKEVVSTLGLENHYEVYQLNDGARILVELVFPSYKFQVKNIEVNLAVRFENSYNSTRGVAMQIFAVRKIGLIWYRYLEYYGGYSHKHTKGLDKNKLQDSLIKGLEKVNLKFNEQFQTMVQKPISTGIVQDTLNNWLDKKVIAQKYLEVMKTNTTPINDVWDFYNMVTEVINSEVTSIDQKTNFSEKLSSEFEKLVK